MRPVIPIYVDEITEDFKEEFWSRTVKHGQCTEWTGALSHGYGRIRMGSRILLAHRLSYVIANGGIPDGLVLDHLCRNPKCVNPQHLEAVTYRENSIRGDNPAFQIVKAEKCGAGHSRHEFGVRSLTNDTRHLWRCTACERDREKRRSADPAERAKKRERMRRLREARYQSAAPTR